LSAPSFTSSFPWKRALALGLVAVIAAGGGFWWRRENARRRAEELARQPLSRLAAELNGTRPQEFCDEQDAHFRAYVAAVVDRFRPQIRLLWAKRKSTEEPRFALLDLGRIQLRLSPRVNPPPKGFDSSSWSWEDAYGLIQRTQQDPDAKENEERWRDLDSITQYLLEKDFLRLKRKVEFLEPEQARHNFRPNSVVSRTGPREFTVRLEIGDFPGLEKVLANVFEQEWKGSDGWHVRVQWVPPGSGAYSLRILLNGNRSFVNHGKRVMLIANLAWTRTVAHELGHILGFDDHYYHVWHPRNCYYSQESRLGDIMSNSDRGSITARHWQILDSAYPWKKEARHEEFSYVYGRE
jgi:hypothetical protein